MYVLVDFEVFRRELFVFSSFSKSPTFCDSWFSAFTLFRLIERLSSCLEPITFFCSILPPDPRYRALLPNEQLSESPSPDLRTSCFRSRRSPASVAFHFLIQSLFRILRTWNTPPSQTLCVHQAQYNY